MTVSIWAFGILTSNTFTPDKVQTTANIAAAMTKLTAEEKADWNYFLDLYQRDGWIGDHAYRKAWADLKEKHPRLREM